MKKYLFYILLATAMLASCDDTTDTIGKSLSDISNHLSIDVAADEFNIASQSVMATRAVSRSPYGYIGRIKDPETKSIVTCNYMTQLRPMNVGSQFPPLDSLYFSDSQANNLTYDMVKDVLTADSCELVVYFPSCFGDSLALMNFVAHELETPYQEKEADNIMIDFDPHKEGKIRKSTNPDDPYSVGVHEQVAFTYSDHTYPDDKKASTEYCPFIRISLNKPYTDKAGKTYKNYGEYLMHSYYNPATQANFNNIYNFVNNVIPGFYVETVGGIGSMLKINGTRLLVYFKGRFSGQQTNSYTVFAGTDEVLQKTQFTQKAEGLQALIDKDNSVTYIKTPSSIYTELNIPIEEMLYNHGNDTLSTARIFVPRVNNTSQSPYAFPTPKKLVLLQSDKIDEFFATRKLTDAKNYYLTNYDSNNNGYTFGNIADLIDLLRDKHETFIRDAHRYVDAELAKNGIDKATLSSKEPLPAKVKQFFVDYRKAFVAQGGKYPFKLTLVPVEATYSTVAGSSTLTKITHDLSLGSTSLMKGKEEYIVNGKDTKSPITVSVMYSNFYK